MSSPDIDPKKRFNYRQRKIWAEGILLGVSGMLKPGDVAIDCGANVGEVTHILADTGAEVFAFEPDPFAHEKLVKRVGKRPNVHIINAAVGMKHGTMKLFRTPEFDDDPDKASTGSTIVEGKDNSADDDENTVEVQVVDFVRWVKALIARRGPIAFMKMDIEGAELDLIEAMEAENLFAHIGCSLVETHQAKFSELRPRFKALRKKMNAKYPLRKINLDYI